MNQDLNIEQRIKKLEELLALKQAYQGVKVMFEPEVKVPSIIKKKVTKRIKELCLELANSVENSEVNTTPTSLTDEDISILKQLAAKVLEKQAPVKKVVVKPSKDKSKAYKLATLLTRDNLTKELKTKVDSEEILKVIKHDKTQASVISKKGFRFTVPLDDLEFQTEGE